MFSLASLSRLALAAATSPTRYGSSSGRTRLLSAGVTLPLPLPPPPPLPAPSSLTRSSTLAALRTRPSPLDMAACARRVATRWYIGFVLTLHDGMRNAPRDGRSAEELRAGGIGGRPGEGMCAVCDGSSEREAGAVLLVLPLALAPCGGE